MCNFAFSSPKITEITFKIFNFRIDDKKEENPKLINSYRMDPWAANDNTKKKLSTQENTKTSLHSMLSSARQIPPQPTGKRVVYPAVPFMTVKEERKCLSEIRSFGDTVPDHFVLSNGMKAEDFALMYVLGHQLKRKEKQQSTAFQSEPDTETDVMHESSVGDGTDSESDVETDIETDVGTDIENDTRG